MCYTPQKWANLYRYIFWYRNTYMLRKLCYQNSVWSYFTLVHVLQWSTAKCQLPARGRAPPYSQHTPTCPFSSHVYKDFVNTSQSTPHSFCLASFHVYLVFKSSEVPLQCFMLPLQGLHSGQVLSMVVGGESSVLLMDPRLGLISVPAAVTWPPHAAHSLTQWPVIHRPLGRMYPELWQSAPSTDN